MNKLLNLFQNKKFIISFFIAIFLMLLILEAVSPVCKGTEKVVKIEKGWGSAEVAQKLKDEQIIRSKWFFVLYAWIKGYSGHLQAGEYLLNPQMSVFKIAKIIATGEVNPNWVKVTIPEGWTNKQIEERLISLGVIGRGEKLPANQEGYLFPDTYYFYKNTPVNDVVKKMSDNFMKRIGEGVSKDLLADSTMKLPNAVIMASILEKEVTSDQDRAIVSGIFWKRIENNHPLESCATIAYILRIDKWRYSYEDTRIDSPYNTYTNLGLPPTPINNPGLSAIKAALYPEQTDYNFFLTAPDGTTIFSKTLEEHNTNKAKYLGY